MGDENSAADPPFDIVSVDQQRRIDLKRSLLEATLGAKLKPGESTSFWGFIGTERQLQLLPSHCELARLRDKYAHTDNEGIRWHDSTAEKTAFHRRLAGLLQVRCHRRERGNYLQISFPADTVTLEVIETGKRLVVFAKGEVLEFWRIDRWRDATSIANLSAFTEEARRALESDDSIPESEQSDPAP